MTPCNLMLQHVFFPFVSERTKRRERERRAEKATSELYQGNLYMKQTSLRLSFVWHRMTVWLSFFSKTLFMSFLATFSFHRIRLCEKRMHTIANVARSDIIHIRHNCISVSFTFVEFFSFISLVFFESSFIISFVCTFTKIFHGKPLFFPEISLCHNPMEIQLFAFFNGIFRVLFALE